MIALQTGFSVAMLVLVILFYLSNPKIKINQWIAAAGFLFWLGIMKQAMLYEIIPAAQRTFNVSGLDTLFMPAHSIMTWAIYTLAMPTLTVSTFYFGYMDKDHPRLMRVLRPAMYLPGFILLFFYSPLRFWEYQFHVLTFWIIYTVYNFAFAAVVTFFVVKGCRKEKKIVLGESKNTRGQRKQVALALLPPLYYWLISVFIPNTLDIKELFELWELGVFIILISIAIFIIMALKDGFMGLKLVSQNYNWNTNNSLMSLINLNAEYASHFLKSQTANMNISTHLLMEHLSDSDNNTEAKEYLEIISRSLSAMEEYFDRIKLLSQIIQLKDENYFQLSSLIRDAARVSLNGKHWISLSVDVPDEVFLLCDRVHITEVFVNIISNAADAVSDSGAVTISGKTFRSKYRLQFTDNGAGIVRDVLVDIFEPLISTKSKDKNTGLGLSYCRNVIMKHNGKISAKSAPGEGTSIIIDFPVKRIRRMAGADI